MSEQCPACGSDEGRYLGSLGALNWCRCRACGWEWPTGDQGEMPDDVYEGAAS